MKTKKFVPLLLATLFLFTALTSCKKEEADDNQDSATENSLAETFFNDVTTISDQAGDGELGTYKTEGTLSTCATVSHDTVLRHIEVDFGTSNCLCSDGRYRRGKILVDYTGRYRDSGSVHTISFDNYFVNDNQLLGTKSVTNNGINGNGNLNFTISVNGQINKANGGGTLSWTANRNREWLAGSATQIWSDDVYLITGSSSGTTASGETFTSLITTALRKEMSCRQIVSGMVEFTPGSRYTRFIDYGSGVCDNTITITINNRTFSVVIQ